MQHDKGVLNTWVERLKVISICYGPLIRAPRRITMPWFCLLGPQKANRKLR
jgi:hypothetical protein